MIARIGADRQRNTQSCAFGDRLKRVVLFGKIARRGGQAGNEIVDMSVANEGRRRGQCISVTGADHAIGGQGAVHHRPGFFLQRHPSDQVARAGLGGQAPIFIGIERAVAVEIAKPQTGFGQYRRGAGAERGLGGRRCRCGRFRCRLAHYQP